MILTYIHPYKDGIGVWRCEVEFLSGKGPYRFFRKESKLNKYLERSFKTRKATACKLKNQGKHKTPWYMRRWWLEDDK